LQKGKIRLMITASGLRRQTVKNSFKEALSTIFPSPEELWDRGGADMKSVEVSSGRYEEVPFFNLDMEMSPDGFGPAIDNRGIVVGDYQAFAVKTSDGIDRTARLYLPNNLHARSDENIHADTAWMTTITGHNDQAASTFVGKTGLPIVIVGAEHGTNQHAYPRELLRLAETLEQSKTISLAKSAQSSQLITSVIRNKFGLSNQFIDTGESRGAMLASGQFPYAQIYGNEIIYTDITAPCIPEKLLAEQADLLRLARWPVAELVGSLALGLTLAKQKALKRKMGTVTLNPNFMLSNIVGIGPALASGEAGVFTKWAPDETAIYLSTFKNDTVSRPEVWRRLFANHRNVYFREHRSGTHMTLANDDVLSSKATRMNMVVDLRKQRPNRKLSDQDWQRIYSVGRRNDILADAA